MRPVFLRHAELAGLRADKASGVSQMIATEPSALYHVEGAHARTLTQAGRQRDLPFRGLWYAARLARAPSELPLGYVSAA